MTGIHGNTAGGQVYGYGVNARTDYEVTDSKASKVKGSANDPPPKNASKVETKAWSPIDTSSMLVPKKTEYGYTIGDVQLSDKAKDYYEKLKAKFHSLEFIAVSKDMKAQVKQNAAAYGNANKMVVLIDEEKLERMATDENFRNKYEGIIAMARSKISEAKNSLVSTGASVKNCGISVDENGHEKFFATVEKSLDDQKHLIEKKNAEKKEQKAAQKKKDEARAAEKRREKKAEEKKAEEKKAEKKAEDAKEQEELLEKAKEDGEPVAMDAKEYLQFEADSLDALLSKISNYSFGNASMRVRCESERMIGGHFDFKG